MAKITFAPDVIRVRALALALQHLTPDEMCSRLAFQELIIERTDDIVQKAIDIARVEASTSDFGIKLLEMLRPLLDQGKAFTAGRKAGTVGPIRMVIKKLLAKNPKMKNPELWRVIKEKPPRGWTAYENRQGKYLEGPKTENMSYSRFCNVSGEERKKLSN
jgi:hypothetical protein